MAIKLYGNTLITGLSSDTKPTVDIPNGTKFTETDTNKNFIFNGTDWKETDILKEDIINDLVTGGIDKPLSAEQGKNLQDNKLDTPFTQGTSANDVVINPSILIGQRGKVLKVKNDESGYEFLDIGGTFDTIDDIAGQAYKNYRNTELPSSYDNIGVGIGAINNNTGYKVIGIGENNTHDNTGNNVVGIGSISNTFNTGNDVVSLGNSNNTNNSGDVVVGIGRANNINNSGCFVVSVGEDNSFGNCGLFVNAIGNGSAKNNCGSFVNSFGYQTTFGNHGSYVNAFGRCASACSCGNHINTFGENAGKCNNGTGAILMGQSSGYLNQGSSVVGIGEYSLCENTGSQVNAIGYSSGAFNNGSCINAFGTNSATYNKGEYVNSLGYESGYRNQGNYVNSVGYESGYNNIGNNVNLFGSCAGAYNSTNNSILFNSTNLKLSSTTTTLNFTSNLSNSNIALNIPSHGLGSNGSYINLYSETYGGRFIQGSIIDADNIQLYNVTTGISSHDFHKITTLDNVGIFNPKQYTEIWDSNIPVPEGNNRMYFGNKQIVENTFYGSVKSDSFVENGVSLENKYITPSAVDGKIDDVKLSSKNLLKQSDLLAWDSCEKIGFNEYTFDYVSLRGQYLENTIFPNITFKPNTQYVIAFDWKAEVERSNGWIWYIDYTDGSYDGFDGDKILYEHFEFVSDKNKTIEKIRSTYGSSVGGDQIHIKNFSIIEANKPMIVGIADEDSANVNGDITEDFKANIMTANQYLPFTGCHTAPHKGENLKPYTLVRLKQNGFIDEKQPNWEVEPAIKGEKGIFGVVYGLEEEPVPSEPTQEEPIPSKPKMKPTRWIIAALGDMPIFVCNENGNIEYGDRLTPSSIQGVAMKSTDLLDPFCGIAGMDVSFKDENDIVKIGITKE